jgi:hypothetical protein
MGCLCSKIADHLKPVLAERNEAEVNFIDEPDLDYLDIDLDLVQL